MNKSELQEAIGKNLYQARLNAHMTQEQLAEKAGISTSFYTNIELGHKGNDGSLRLSPGTIFHE